MNAYALAPGNSDWISALVFGSSYGEFEVTSTWSSSGSVAFVGAMDASVDVTFAGVGGFADVGGAADVVVDATWSSSGSVDVVVNLGAAVDAEWASSALVMIDGVAALAVDINTAFAGAGYLPVTGVVEAAVLPVFEGYETIDQFVVDASVATTLSVVGVVGVIVSGGWEVQATAYARGLSLMKEDLNSRLGPGHHTMRQPRRRRSP